MVACDVLQAANVSMYMLEEGLDFQEAHSIVHRVPPSALIKDYKKYLHIRDEPQILIMELGVGFRVVEHRGCVCALCGWETKDNDFRAKEHIRNYHPDFLLDFPEFNGAEHSLILPHMKIAVKSTASLHKARPVVGFSTPEPKKLVPICPIPMATYEKYQT